MKPSDAVSEGGVRGVPADSVGAPRQIRLFIHALRTPGSTFSLIFLGLVILMAIFAPQLAQLSGWGPYDFDQEAVDPATGGLPIGSFGGISAEHWFGVEPQSGRDIFARVAYGARVSMLIALSATAVTTLIGVILGTLAGFFGGIIDQIVSRLMDFLMAFPSLIFMIALLSALPSGNRTGLLIAVLSIFGWPYIGRVVRSQALSLAKREFVEAAYASGASRLVIVFREVLPNLVGTIIVMSTLSVPLFISTEAGLSFLGVGVTPPEASWGQMISAAVGWYTVDPMYFLIPGAFLTLTVLSFMVLGDRLQTVLDPRGRNS